VNHIHVALDVLKYEIKRLESDLRYGNHPEEIEEEITEKLQKLHRAVSDIQKAFNL